MPDSPTQIYVAFEPDHDWIAERLSDWPRTNADLKAYNSRYRMNVDSAEAEPYKQAIKQQLASSGAVVCIVGQTTFLDPWIDWELRTARARPNRPGFVAIMLNDLFGHPPALANAGTMYVPLRQTYVIDAIAWAAEQCNPSEDFILEDG